MSVEQQLDANRFFMSSPDRALHVTFERFEPNFGCAAKSSPLESVLQAFFFVCDGGDTASLTLIFDIFRMYIRHFCGLVCEFVVFSIVSIGGEGMPGLQRV